MKVEVSNLLILGAAPILAIGIYNYYSSSFRLEENHNENKNSNETIQESNNKTNIFLNEISCQTECENENERVNENKNENNCESENLDLSNNQVNYISKKSPSNKKENFEDEIHFVELNGESYSNSANRNKKSYYNFVKKWFGS